MKRCACPSCSFETANYRESGFDDLTTEETPSPSADEVGEHVVCLNRSPLKSFSSFKSYSLEKGRLLLRTIRGVSGKAKALALLTASVGVLCLVTLYAPYDNGRDEVAELCDQARLYCLSGRCEEAITLLVEGISKSPDAVQLYNELGISYEKVGEYDKSLEVLRKAIQLDGKNAQAHYYLGINHIRQGARDAGLVQYKILKSLDKEKADLLYSYLYE